MVGVIVFGVVVEVVRMAWFVERRVWLLWWEDCGSEALFESDVGGGGGGCCEAVVESDVGGGGLVVVGG